MCPRKKRGRLLRSLPVRGSNFKLSKGNFIEISIPFKEDWSASKNY